ncbi:related to TSR1 - protein involved in 20S rRNA accumulation [Melanopsichium pennsylvanicum]|uniref:Related to TSR1 - protein involved in 20S rRNA accumulation n=2 Tax=Melanopsichium pennsylvanicum TaxID=63383 RepID=A0AAJ4XNY3_9BASI|nr:related to TSR1-protein involved in 20S rRNA accumulation [Melanopsichium pennsylvanicum 4]SNX86439.1 related to TSR1 - protein involved in 20S rRNA accumulation [Melanopsichium pennsylvanicum]
MPHHHRASSLRQSNKAFKSKHSTKTTLREASKGRSASDVSSTSRLSSHKASPLSASGNEAGSRQHRRNHAKQAQRSKRNALVQSNRIFSVASSTRREAKDGLSKGFAGAGAGAPRICAVVDLAEDGDSWEAVRKIQQEGIEGGVQPVAGRSVEDALRENLPYCELEAARFRQTIQFLPLPYGALYPILDACKCADFVLLVLSASTAIDPGSWGELCLRTLQAQGLPTVVVAVTTLHPDGATGVGGSKKAGAALKAANEVRKSLLSFAQYFSPDVEKVHALDDRAERGALLRTLATATPKRVAWRDFRAWMVSEQAEFEPSSQANDNDVNELNGLSNQDEQRGTLKVTGWIRGAPLSADRLIHLPDFGDFQVDKITYAPPPNARTKRSKVSAITAAGAAGADDDEMTDAETGKPEDAPLMEGDVLQTRDQDFADDLVSENEPDDMANEQTWPTEEEMKAAEEFARQRADGEMPPPPALPGTTPKTIIKGSGNAKDNAKYRAAWIIESDQENSDEDSGAADDDDSMILEGDEENVSEMGAGDAEVNEAMDDYERMKAAAIAQQTSDAQSEMAYEDMDDAQAQEAYLAYQAQRTREREERTDAEFPDEVDTPLEIAARTRFARYRGLKSFRTSPWDAYEDLPRDYARIFQFENFHKTRRRVEGAALLDGVQPGFRVTVHVKDVPYSAGVRACATNLGANLAKVDCAVPFVMFGLLRHEHKKSVINFTVTRNTEYEAPVRSKDALVLCLGPRRFRINPIFSQHSRGGGKGVNNVHKFERFLRKGVSASVGTVYAPITFGGSTAPAVLLRERSLDGEEGYDQRGVSAAQMPHLVGFGNLMDASPTRINAKRILLSGHPFKVHKKTATIRFMFFNPEDVYWFKPITLHTKLGRTGHITESLGTHGYFKAHFDGPISQMDTVLMNLYKRVYPKWAQPFRQAYDELPLPRNEVNGSNGKIHQDEGSMEE